jgi:hypothetical protein
MNSTFCFSTGIVLGVVVGIAVLSRPSQPDVATTTDLNLVTSPDPLDVPLAKNININGNVAVAMADEEILHKAREAALRGDANGVRHILEAKVRGGSATSDEANLVRQACKAMNDRACSNDIKRKYNRT